MVLKIRMGFRKHVAQMKIVHDVHTPLVSSIPLIGHRYRSIVLEGNKAIIEKRVEIRDQEQPVKVVNLFDDRRLRPGLNMTGP